LDEVFEASLTFNYGEIAGINAGEIDVFCNTVDLVSRTSALTWG